MYVCTHAHLSSLIHIHTVYTHLDPANSTIIHIFTIADMYVHMKEQGKLHHFLVGVTLNTVKPL